MSTAPAPRSTIPGSQREVRSATASVLTRTSSRTRSRLGERLVGPETGVVDEHVDAQREALDVGLQTIARGRVGDVAGERLGADPVAPRQLLGERAVEPESGAGSGGAGHPRDMANYTKLNLKHDVEDMAPKFGYAENVEARFARKPLGLEQSGVSYFKVAPGFRMPFGHRHLEQEEVYLVVSGSARFKLEDEIVELSPFDVVRVPGSTPRAMEAGPDGAEIVAFGAPNTDNKDAEMLSDFWPPEN